MEAVQLPWSIDDIDFAGIDVAATKDDETLFFVLASAALIESGSDLYTSVLIDYFGPSPAGRWLLRHWEPEEMQHGAALRRYIGMVWPEFDWDATNEGFMREYSSYCSLSALEPTPTLELVARCVVETGTAALYRSLQDYTTEPVLKRLAGLIRSDEVRHYKNFHRFFHQYNAASGHGRWPVLRALTRRLAEMRNEDADCALRHVFRQRYPGESVDSAHFRAISVAARGLVMRHIVPEMMVKMFLQPLQLPGYVRNSLQKPCSQVMRLFMTH